SFRFNGWGGKYILPDDDRVSERVAEAAKVPMVRSEFILEGGAIEPNGEGVLLTTEQCLLNPNRNADLDRKQIEALLTESFNLRKVIWIKEGLLNDHTDGHIDTLARFVDARKIVCMRGDKNDPNYEVL